jgi:rhodopsin domain-containing protein
MLTAVEQAYTHGKHLIYINPVDLMYAIKYSYIALYFWAWTIAFLKTSVCLMLLRILNTTVWRWAFAIMILIQFVSGIGITITFLFLNRPITANWDPKIPKTQCSPCNMAGYVYMGVTTATDAACALFPLTFIVQVKRPIFEKIVLTFIMGLGLLACAFGISKFFAVLAIRNDSDPLWQNAHAVLLALVFSYSPFWH